MFKCTVVDLETGKPFERANQEPVIHEVEEDEYLKVEDSVLQFATSLTHLLLRMLETYRTAVSKYWSRELARAIRARNKIHVPINRGWSIHRIEFLVDRFCDRIFAHMEERVPDHVSQIRSQWMRIIDRDLQQVIPECYPIFNGRWYDHINKANK
jgi:hypothetical protein